MRPQFTVIAATYNVAPYIDAFLASLDRQTYGPQDIEVIVVDDGSTDGSGELAEAWAAATTVRATVVRQENAGQGAARNAGLDLASGEWVTFADPDDVLADSYFAEVAAFLAAQRQQPDMLATRLLTFTEDHTRHVNRHALRDNFKNRNQLVDLARFPDRIHLSGGSAFFRLDRVRAAGTRFDSRIRPTFEDAHFVGVYLLETAAPLVGFIRTAEYYYRKRTDGTSSVQSAWSRDDKYTDVLRHGYLDLLKRGAERHGRAPAWIQNTVVYDLMWYFKADTRMTSATGSVRAEVLAEFHELCAEIFALIDVETILGFHIVRTAHWLRLALVAGYKDLQMRPQQIRLDNLDERQQLVRARYTYSGSRPEEAFYWRGQQVEPVHQKVRSIEFFGRALAHERIVWLPSNGTLRITLDGRPVPLSTRNPSDLPYQITGTRLAEDFGIRAKPPWRGRRARVLDALAAPKRRVEAAVSRFGKRFGRQAWTARITRWLADSLPVRRRYAGAWVLMDRQDQAQDSAEHLYRYLRREQPAVNAWFVLDRASTDWQRLHREGFRLVAFGSLRWRVLLRNARHVISSHANGFALSPLPRNLYGAPSWQFTFLQHGIGKDDYSRWLADKRIHLLVTTTEAEERSFSGDGTPYVFTTKEVQRTGLPRHDELLRRARALTPRQVDRILVMPTWRRSLIEGQPESHTPEQRAEAFRASEFAQEWLGLLHAPELRALAERSGSRISFLPHPNMTPLLRRGDVPDHVELLTWADVDVQDVFAATRLLLTDYSSMAFEVGLLGRPTVYFQFDREEFFSGAQPYRRGYFDYDRDAFGPIARSQDEVVQAVKQLAEDDFVPAAEYARRIEETFGERTGDSCLRVFRAIRALDHPVPARELTGAPTVASPAAPVPDETLAGEVTIEEAVTDGPGTDGTVPQGVLPHEILTEHRLATEALVEEALAEEALIPVSPDGVLLEAGDQP
jgi:glycosyltransferase involved in cell wall biosynthesis